MRWDTTWIDTAFAVRRIPKSWRRKRPRSESSKPRQHRGNRSDGRKDRAAAHASKDVRERFSRADAFPVKHRSERRGYFRWPKRADLPAQAIQGEMDRHCHGCDDSGRLGLCDERHLLIAWYTRRAPKGNSSFLSGLPRSATPIRNATCQSGAEQEALSWPNGIAGQDPTLAIRPPTFSCFILTFQKIVPTCWTSNIRPRINCSSSNRGC